MQSRQWNQNPDLVHLFVSNPENNNFGCILYDFAWETSALGTQSLFLKLLNLFRLLTR